MDTGLKGKTVLITGGASGIGLGISTVCAKEGMDIAIASRNPDIKVREQIEALGVKCILIHADLGKEENIKRMVAEAISGLGNIDAFVNNAAWTWHQPITKITVDSWQATMDTNLRACVFSCREISKHMIERKKGNITIIGSTVRFFPAYTETSYRISKMGLKIFMEQMVIEMAPFNIRVNMVTPGHFVTRMTGKIPEKVVDKLIEMTPCGRTGDPVEIGNAVAFLLSDKLSGFTCGADLVVDGGLSVRSLMFINKKKAEKLNT